MQNTYTFLMFEGKAEEAMLFYTSLLEGSTITSIERYQANEGGAEGSVKIASFTLNDKEYKCIDSPASHGFTFTPAISLYVDCDSEEQLNILFEKLSENGNILMPLAEYPFSNRFGWLSDKYGVSWQLNLLTK
ncbi:MAG: VOC family protein [Saprospiraceae bacterium]